MNKYILCRAGLLINCNPLLIPDYMTKIVVSQKYLYLPACHVIINQHQRNREHANVIIIKIFIFKSQGHLKQIYLVNKI